MSQSATVAPGHRAAHATLTHDQVVLRFAGVQLFSVIYLQKFALFSLSFPLSVPMLIMFVGIAWMVVWKHMVIRPRRLAAFLVFLGCCLFSEAFETGSMASLLMVVVLYACLTVSVELSESLYQQILKLFVRFMVLPACIVIGQYSYEVLTHHSDPLRLDLWVPPSFLLQGYNYAGHFPWNSYFVRPQGFFFLEPSFMSAFAAAAAVIEIAYFRRWRMVLLMVVAIFLTHGDTGIVLLLGALPFLLAREKPLVVVGVVAGGVLAISAALALQIPLPLLSRTSQLDIQGSSAYSRLVMPAETFERLVFDPSYLLLGDGAGATTSPQERENQGDPRALQKEYNGHTLISNPWPIVKVLREYGLLSMIAFVGFYLIGISGKFNVPLKVGLSLVYLFTGGYFLNPILVDLMACLCFMFTPRNNSN